MESLCGCDIDGGTAVCAINVVPQPHLERIEGIWGLVETEAGRLRTACCARCRRTGSHTQSHCCSRRHVKVVQVWAIAHVETRVCFVDHFVVRAPTHVAVDVCAIVVASWIAVSQRQTCDGGHSGPGGDEEQEEEAVCAGARAQRALEVRIVRLLLALCWCNTRPRFAAPHPPPTAGCCVSGALLGVVDVLWVECLQLVGRQSYSWVSDSHPELETREKNHKEYGNEMGQIQHSRQMRVGKSKSRQILTCPLLPVRVVRLLIAVVRVLHGFLASNEGLVERGRHTSQRSSLNFFEGNLAHFAQIRA
eukprot:m.868839 g.868839  ORF g.868839 m.868839 type:complete len:306 (-) comp59739_c0_seq37:1784-2701(-)